VDRSRLPDALLATAWPRSSAYGDFSEESGMVGMRKLLAQKPDLDAVFTASDPMALGAIRVLAGGGQGGSPTTSP